MKFIIIFVYGHVKERDLLSAVFVCRLYGWVLTVHMDKFGEFIFITVDDHEYVDPGEEEISHKIHKMTE